MSSERETRSFTAFAAACVFVAVLAGPTASPASETASVPQPTAVSIEKDPGWRRAGPQLMALHERYTAQQASGSAQAFAQQVPYMQVVNDTVAIDAAADGDVDELKAALAGLGAVDIVSFKRMVSARVPLEAIPKLNDIDELHFARPVMARTYVGATTSQGDVAMNADDARSAFGIDGDGVTVGVLSDTFDCAGGGYATDMGTLDLPAGIEVLADFPCGIDEGRAMLQLIHDVAPGAGLSFHTAFGGEAIFALGIQELAGCPSGSEPGCTPAAGPAQVIVDDVGYFATPMFQDGIIAQAVDVVADADVAYFSSAGNSGRASYEGMPFDSSGISPPGYFLPGDGDAHDFDPGAGVDIYQEVMIPPGPDTVISFQWDQPFFSVSGAPGSANDMDICLYAEPPGAGPIIPCAAAGNAGADPVEVLAVPGPMVANIVIVKYLPAGGPDPDLMKYVAFNDDFTIVDTYPMTLASTSFGQNTATGAIGVGAAFYFDTPEFGTDPALKEPFSSAGGTPILFDTTGTLLPMPLVRLRPQIVAPDGTNTTFFGSSDPETDGFPNFFGTSAAAPHAAAVAALMLEASPGLTRDGIEAVMRSSAGGQDMLGPGFDFDTGFGLLDGETAVASVEDSTACDGVESLDLELEEFGVYGPATYSATDTITFGTGDFSDTDSFAPMHIFADGFESGDTSSWSNTCP